MSYYEKYLKYKTKYLNLKAQIGGAVVSNVKSDIQKFNEVKERGVKNFSQVIDLINKKKSNNKSPEFEVDKWINLTIDEDWLAFHPSNDVSKTITNNLVEELKREIKKDISIPLKNESKVITYLRALESYISYNHNGCAPINALVSGHTKTQHRKTEVFESPETCNSRMRDLTKSIFHNRMNFKDILVNKLKFELNKGESYVKALIKKEASDFENYIGKL